MFNYFTADRIGVSKDVIDRANAKIKEFNEEKKIETRSEERAIKKVKSRANRKLITDALCAIKNDCRRNNRDI